MCIRKLCRLDGGKQQLKRGVSRNHKRRRGAVPFVSVRVPLRQRAVGLENSAQVLCGWKSVRGTMLQRAKRQQHAAARFADSVPPVTAARSSLRAGKSAHAVLGTVSSERWKAMMVFVTFLESAAVVLEAEIMKLWKGSAAVRADSG